MGEEDIKAKARPHGKGFRFYLAAGIFTVIPLWITVLAILFVFNVLSGIGSPLVTTLWGLLRKMVPALAEWATPDWLQSLLAVLITFAAFYLIGRIGTHVVGSRLIRFVDLLIERIPFAKTIYGNTKKLLTVLQRPPGGRFDRVVLIDFPTPGMKALGFMTAQMQDEKTGETLAAVFVPTTPNPTSGYLEVVPLKNLVITNWGIEEAMKFIISGGVSFPDKIRYYGSPVEGRPG